MPYEKVTFWVVVAFLALATMAFAAYTTTVSRVDDDLYKSAYGSTYYVTSACYVYIYYADAVVDEYEGWIYFIDAETKCYLREVIR